MPTGKESVLANIKLRKLKEVQLRRDKRFDSVGVLAGRMMSKYRTLSECRHSAYGKLPACVCHVKQLRRDPAFFKSGIFPKLPSLTNFERRGKGRFSSGNDVIYNEWQIQDVLTINSSRALFIHDLLHFECEFTYRPPPL